MPLSSCRPSLLLFRQWCPRAPKLYRIFATRLERRWRNSFSCSLHTTAYCHRVMAGIRDTWPASIQPPLLPVNLMSQLRQWLTRPALRWAVWYLTCLLISRPSSQSPAPAASMNYEHFIEGQPFTKLLRRVKRVAETLVKFQHVTSANHHIAQSSAWDSQSE